MIKSFTAATSEIDDPQAAVADILGQLNPRANLLAHSLGIISCFSEFEETGVLKAICEALPFECIGATTCLGAGAGHVDQVIFILTVLTSNDCRFATSAIPIGAGAGEVDEAVARGAAPLLDKDGEKPVFFFSYLPLINTVSGDMMLEAMDKVTGGIPLFGTVAVDHNADFATVRTIRNGKSYPSAMVLGAVYGAPRVTFEVASLDERQIRSQKAVITASSGNILSGVNGKTALGYLEEIGLTREELSTGLGVIPFVIDYRDGTKPLARAVFTLTPEGYAVCGGVMPAGATMSIGHIDKAAILETTCRTLHPLLAQGGAVFCYSCVGRYHALGADSTAEADAVADAAQGTPYQFAHCGGEICPLPDGEGKLKNYFHNYTAVFCRID